MIQEFSYHVSTRLEQKTLPKAGRQVSHFHTIKPYASLENGGMNRQGIEHARQNENEICLSDSLQWFS